MTCAQGCSGNRLCSSLQGRFRRNLRAQVSSTATDCPYHPTPSGPSDFSTVAAESAGRQYRAVRRLLLPVAGLQPQRQDDGGDGNRVANCKSSTMNIISNSGRTPDAAGEWRRRAAGSTAEGSPRAHPPTAPSTETIPEQHRQIANLPNWASAMRGIDSTTRAPAPAEPGSYVQKPRPNRESFLSL